MDILAVGGWLYLSACVWVHIMHDAVKALSQIFRVTVTLWVAFILALEMIKSSLSREIYISLPVATIVVLLITSLIPTLLI